MTDNEESSYFTKSDSKSEGLAETESYRDLLNDTETMRLLRMEIENILDIRLQEIGISPKWNGIPQKTYEKTMGIVQHQRNLLKKSVPNFDHTKEKLDRAIRQMCRKTKESANLKPVKINSKQKTVVKTRPVQSRRQENAKPRQNIVKIVCRPKLKSKKSTDTLILPTRRSSVTISNPILFETQDSSSDSEIYEAKSSMNNVIDELKLNLKCKDENVEMHKARNNFDINLSENGDSSSSKTNKHLSKQQTNPKTRTRLIHKEIITTSTNKTKSLVKESIDSSFFSTSERSERSKNLKIKSKKKMKTSSIETNNLYNAGTSDLSSVESSTRFANKKSNLKNKKERVEINDFTNTNNEESVTNQTFSKTRSSLASLDYDFARMDISSKASIRFTDINTSESSENDFEYEKSGPTKTNLASAKSSYINDSKALRTQLYVDKKNYELEKNTKSEQSRKTAQSASLSTTKEQNDDTNEYENVKNRQNNPKNILSDQSLISQEHLTKIESNLDIFASSSDENIIQMFKTTEELNVQKSSGFPETKLTRVLPKIKMTEKVGNRFKKVLFDVDND